jgi:hypothetical protein
MRGSPFRPTQAIQTVLLLFVSPALLAAMEPPPAFPGAEGFGARASGGRGGAVYYVTNLDDSGPGSLRDAVTRGDRMVLFKVSGTIDIKRGLVIKPSNLTIAGETAPGDGICIKGDQVVIVGKNVIVRYLRFRPGDEERLGEPGYGNQNEAGSASRATPAIICSNSLSTFALKSAWIW